MNSFIPGTRVLMADGTAKSIEDIEVGDKVLATDPIGGETAAKTVVGTITTQGWKNLVKLTVGTDGASGSKAGTIIATADHPLWAPQKGQWVGAANMRVGDALRNVYGALVDIEGLRAYRQQQRVHNLTIADVHTYYVLAGQAPVLVHNTNCGFDLDSASQSGSRVDPSDSRGEFTMAGNAAAKKAGRSGSRHDWPVPPGTRNPNAWNTVGQKMLDEILTHSGVVEIPWRGEINGV